MREKYQRRIDRFYALNRYPGKIYLIRTAFDYLIDSNPYWNPPGIDRIGRDKAMKLQRILSQFFPDFALN